MIQMGSPKGLPPREAAPYAEVDGLPVELDLSQLSLSGLFAYTASPPALNGPVQIFLRIREHSTSLTGIAVQVVTCEAAARDGSRPGFGMLFTDVGAAERRFLRCALDPSSDVRSPAPAQRTGVRPRGHSPLPAPTPAAADSPRHTASQAACQAACEKARQTLRRELSRQENYAPYRVLNVDARAAPAAARRAFLGLAKRAHPHRYARFRDADVTDLATRVFIGYRRAFDSFMREQAGR